MLKINKKLFLSLSLLLPFTTVKAVEPEHNIESQEQEDTNRGCGCGGGVVAPRPHQKPKPKPNQLKPRTETKLFIHNLLSGLFNKSEDEIKSILDNVSEDLAKDLPALKSALEDLNSKVGPELEHLVVSYGPLIVEILVKVLASSVA